MNAALEAKRKLLWAVDALELDAETCHLCQCVQTYLVSATKVSISYISLKFKWLDSIQFFHRVHRAIFKWKLSCSWFYLVSSGFIQHEYQLIIPNQSLNVSSLMVFLILNNWSLLQNAHTSIKVLQMSYNWRAPLLRYFDKDNVCD